MTAASRYSELSTARQQFLTQLLHVLTSPCHTL